MSWANDPVHTAHERLHVGIDKIGAPQARLRLVCHNKASKMLKDGVWFLTTNQELELLLLMSALPMALHSHLLKLSLSASWDPKLSSVNQYRNQRNRSAVWPYDSQR